MLFDYGHYRPSTSTQGIFGQLKGVGAQASPVGLSLPTNNPYSAAPASRTVPSLGPAGGTGQRGLLPLMGVGATRSR